MVTCVAFGCTNRSNHKIPGVTFHKFPKDERRRALWVKAVRRANWNPSCHSSLCSKHFSEDMIDRTSLAIVRLRENAVPSIFEGFPSYLKKKMAGSNKSFRAADKLTVVSVAEEKGNTAAAKEFGVNPRYVRRTMKQQIKEMPEKKRVKRSLGSHEASWPDLEDELEVWIKQNGKRCTWKEICHRAKSMAGKMSVHKFCGTRDWCLAFMNRKKLKPYLKPLQSGQRVNTETNCDNTSDLSETLEQNFHPVIVKLEPQEIVDKSSFLNHISSIIKEHNLTSAQIMVMDEISFSFEFVHSSVNKKPILVSGFKNRAFSCVFTCTADGKKLKPLVIFKGAYVPKGDYPCDVAVCADSKGNMSETHVTDWLSEAFQVTENVSCDPQGVLIVDSRHENLLQFRSEECKKIFTAIASIAHVPDNFVSFRIRRIFEIEMMKHFEVWLADNFHLSSVKSMMKKLAPKDIARWVSDSWNSITVPSIIFAFYEANVINLQDVQNSKSAENNVKANYENGDSPLCNMFIFSEESGESDSDGFDDI